jgi:hypothetical protein
MRPCARLNTDPASTNEGTPDGWAVACLSNASNGPVTKETFMRSRLFAAIIATVLAILPIRVALSQARFSVSGGLAAPMSDLGDAADLGYNVGAGLNFGGTYLPIGARIEGSLSQFSLKNLNEDVRILNATANAVVNIGQGNDSPYLIGGLGIYNSKFGNADSENAVGANLGGGLRFPIGGLNAFFEARYHAMLGDRGAGANLQFIPITLGIVF